MRDALSILERCLQEECQKIDENFVKELVRNTKVSLYFSNSKSNYKLSSRRSIKSTRTNRKWRKRPTKFIVGTNKIYKRYLSMENQPKIRNL